MDSTPPTRKRSLELEPDLDDSGNSQAKKKPVDKDTPTPSLTGTSEAKATNLMRNELILEKIASNMPARDLWNLRSSGPIWNNAFIPQLKHKQKMIKLEGKSRSTIDLLQVIQSSLDNPFTSYNFDLDSKCGGISIRDRTCFPNFVLAIGNTITKLELKWKRAADLSVYDLRKIIFNWTPQLTDLILTSSDYKMPKQDKTLTSKNHDHLKVLPKLKLIEVWVKNAKGNTDWIWLNVTFTQLISDAIQSAVGLQYLNLFDDSDNMNLTRDTIAGLLQNRTSSHVDTLTNLSLNATRSANLPNAVLQDLIELATTTTQQARASGPQQPQLQIRAFAVCVQCWSRPNDQAQADIIENFRLLHSFLVTQSPTLKELLLDGATSGNDDEVLIPCRLPVLEQLNNLEVFRTGLVSENLENQFFEDGKFRDNFPHLSHFSYKHVAWSEYGPCFPEVVDVLLYHPGVTGLTLDYDLCDGSDIADFTSFSTVFPSLTRLELKLTINQNITLFDTPEFMKIWTTWPALRVLHICWTKCGLDMDLDTLISGIPRSRLERLRYEHKALFPDGGDGAGELEPEPDALDTTNTTAQDSLREVLVNYNKSWPGISDLKNLQEFAFTFEDYDEDKPQLTDMGGYCGIGMASPSLQRVVIQDVGKNLVSEHCLAFMRKKFGLLAELSL